MSIDEPPSLNSTNDMSRQLQHSSQHSAQHPGPEKRGYDGEALQQGSGRDRESMGIGKASDVLESLLMPWRAAGAQSFEDEEMEDAYGQFFIDAMYRGMVPFMQFILAVASCFHGVYLAMRMVRHKPLQLDDCFMLLRVAMILSGWVTTTRWSRWTGQTKIWAATFMVWVVRLRIFAVLLENFCSDVPLQKSFLSVFVVCCSSTVLSWSWKHHILNTLVLTSARHLSTLVHPGLLEKRGYELGYLLTFWIIFNGTSLLSLSLHERYRSSFRKIWAPRKRE